MWMDNTATNAIPKLDGIPVVSLLVSLDNSRYSGYSETYP